MTAELKATLLSLFIQYGLPVLLTLLAGGASWVLAQLGRKLAADTSGSKLLSIVNKVVHLSETVVADLEATLRPELKAAAADGVLEPAEVARIRDVALQRLKALLGEAGLAELQKLLGLTAQVQVDHYLRGVVEKAVDGLPPTTARP